MVYQLGRYFYIIYHQISFSLILFPPLSLSFFFLSLSLSFSFSLSLSLITFHHPSLILPLHCFMLSFVHNFSSPLIVSSSYTSFILVSLSLSLSYLRHIPSRLSTSFSSSSSSLQNYRAGRWAGQRGVASPISEPIKYRQTRPSCAILCQPC